MGKARMVWVPLLAGALLAGGAPATEPQDVTVNWQPSPPKPGSALQVLVTNQDGTSAEPLTAVNGQLAGERLHFTPDVNATGQFRALAAIPLNSEAEQQLALTLTFASGRQEERRMTVEVSVDPDQRREAPTPGRTQATATERASPPPERLRVAPRFTERQRGITAARIRAEGAMTSQSTRRSHNTPKLWSGSFVRPRESRITSPFGRVRIYNDARSSVHMGVDLAGPVGSPVRATNRGVVMLIGHFHYAGTAIYVDHGGGLVTGYFHLSGIDVAVGDTVTAGQVIGQVGATGQVTGPHLHWMARYGRITFDPLTLLDLDS